MLWQEEEEGGVLDQSSLPFSGESQDEDTGCPAAAPQRAGQTRPVPAEISPFTRSRPKQYNKNDTLTRGDCGWARVGAHVTANMGFIRHVEINTQQISEYGRNVFIKSGEAPSRGPQGQLQKHGKN